MTLLRSAVPVVARLTALALLTGQLVLAGAATCTMCAAVTHDCSAALVAACCDRDNADASRAAGPIEPAIRVTPAAVAAVAHLPHQIAPPAVPALPVEGAPATAVPADLTILLANLRV